MRKSASVPAKPGVPSPPAAATVAARLKLALEIFLYFVRIGSFTFGGGWSIVAQIQKEFVEKRGWITGEELLDITSVGRSIPGLMIGNVSFIFGYHVCGLAGGFAAVFGIMFSLLVILCLVTLGYTAVKDNVFVARAMVGVRAAVVPIIGQAAMKLWKGAFKDAWGYGIALIALGLSLLTPVNNLFIIFGAAGIGLLLMEVKNRGLH